MEILKSYFLLSLFRLFGSGRPLKSKVKRQVAVLHFGILIRFYGNHFGIGSFF